MRSVPTGYGVLAILVLSVGMQTVAGQRAGTTWAEHRANLQQTIREIDSGQMLWVNAGDQLVPVLRNEFIHMLTLGAVAPQHMLASSEYIALRVPPPIEMDRLRRAAREAVVSTEAFRRALVEELQLVERYLNADATGAMAGRAFDLRDPAQVRAYLTEQWELDIQLTTRSSAFRPQEEFLQRTRGAVLQVTEATCNATASNSDVSCALTGRVAFRGEGNLQRPVVGNVGAMFEDLRMASYTTQGATGGGSVRFAIRASEAGGNLEFSGTLSAVTGRMENGTVRWSANRVNDTVGTWAATRGAR